MGYKKQIPRLNKCGSFSHVTLTDGLDNLRITRPAAGVELD
jgi:hypothetical protein